MRISSTGIALIKEFEGCRLEAYQDSVGVWTIGYGHTENVKNGQYLFSETEANSLLLEDLTNKYEKKVNAYDNIYSWNQNEYDALVSFAYNIGSIGDLTAHATREKKVIASKILEYNKAGGKVLAGLTRRRQREHELFLRPVITAPYTKGWNYDENGRWYATGDRSYFKNCWQIIDGHKFYFNKDGYAVTNWQLIDSAWYYFEPVKGSVYECALYVSDKDGKQSVGKFGG